MAKEDSMLIPSDDGLNHQIADTFAAVSHSDPAWTEKVWGSVFKNDGTLGLGWGLGKYLNRNVMDGYAGVSRGVEQWTVRGSRMLFTFLLVLLIVWTSDAAAYLGISASTLERM